MQHGIDYRRRDKSKDWREEGDEELYPMANYLTSDLGQAQRYAQKLNGGGRVYKVNAEGLNLQPDVDEDWGRSAFYPQEPIGPDRVTPYDESEEGGEYLASILSGSLNPLPDTVKIGSGSASWDREPDGRAWIYLEGNREDRQYARQLLVGHLEYHGIELF